MKIRVIDRIVLFLLALIALVVGICAALNEFGIQVLSLIPAGILPELSARVLFIVRIAVIAAVILVSFYLFGISFRRKKKPEPFIHMESGSKGSIRMSMESISGLVLRTCGSIPGISGLKVSTINHEDSVSVDMAFQVEVDRNIPELSGQIQQMVGEVVEKNCGVAVRNVCVTVSGFVNAKAPAALPEAEKAPKKGLFGRSKEVKAEEKIEAEMNEIPVVPVIPVIVPEEPAAEPVIEEIPVANAYSMEELLKAVRRYIDKTGRRVVFEYALVKGVNCAMEHADELASRLRGMQCHVNLIPLNDVEERDLRGPSRKEIDAFLQRLEMRHISVTRRREMGDDIQGACGQLRRSVLDRETE